MQAEKLRKDVYMPFFQVPVDLKKVARVFYGSRHLEFFYFEALPNKKDCYISTRYDGNLLCGKIRAFFRKRDEEFVATELMKILKSHSSPIGSSCEVYSYHVVEDSSERLSVNVKAVCDKFFHMALADTVFLIPLIKIFEHD